MEVEVCFSIELKSLVQMTGDLSIGGLEIDGHGAHEKQYRIGGSGEEGMML